MSSTPLRSALTVGATVLLAGCISSSSRNQWRVPTRAESTSAMAILVDLLPAQSRQLHRVVIRGAGREALLTGHLELHRRAGFRAVAVDELGGPPFAFVHCPDRSTVVEAPPGVDPDILVRGPVADLALAFMLPAAGPDLIAETAADAVLRWDEGARRRECVVDRAAGRLLSCREWQGRRVLRELRYRYRSDGGETALAGISIDSRALHYQMELEILELRPLAQELAQRDWCAVS